MQPVGFLNGFTLVFEDHFEGAALDAGAWGYREDGPNATLRSQQVIGNVSVSGGVGDSLLHLTQSKVGSDYFGGGIISTVVNYTYGFFEARIKIASARGWHPAFWLVETAHVEALYLSEIDIMENFAAELTTTHRFGAHVETGTDVNGSFPVDLTDDFRVFGAWHLTDEVRFYLDGELIRRLPYTADESADMNLILSTVSLEADTIFDEDLPVDMLVDWVRIYSVAGAGPTVATPVLKRRLPRGGSAKGAALCQENIGLGRGGDLLGTGSAMLRAQLEK